MLTDLTRRVGVVPLFITEVAPQLPAGWQDNAAQIGGIAVSVLLSAAAAIRRVTEVPASQRGILPTRLHSGGRITGPPSGSVHLHVEGSVTSERDIADAVRRAGRHRL